MHNRYPNRRWIFLTSGDVATGVNFNQVMETSPATCRYNVAPTPGTETFVKYNVTVYPQHSGEEPQITVFSGWHQDSPADQPTWQNEEQYPETAVQSGTDDTYKYDYEVTGSGAFLEWSKSTMTGGGWVDGLSIMNGGSGYSSDGNLTASGGGGNGFAGTFTQDSGVIDSVHITNSGEYYTANPAVIIDNVEGSGGEIFASANPGEPTEPAITGTGYYPLYADNILGSGFFAASGQVTGQPDCFHLALEVEASGGRVTVLDIVSGGSAYSSSGSLTAVGGGGNGFEGTFLATTSGGWVNALHVVSGGAGYSSDGTLTAVGGGGSGFAGTFAQTSGVINSAMIVDKGENYVSDPEITIVSAGGINGTGGIISSSVRPSGALSSTSLVNGGQGYASEPTVVIGANGTDAIVTAKTNSWSASGYEFDHPDMLNVLSGPDWTPTGIM